MTSRAQRNGSRVPAGRARHSRSTAPRRRPASAVRAPRCGARATWAGRRVLPSCSAPARSTTSSCAATRRSARPRCGCGRGGTPAGSGLLTAVPLTTHSPTHLSGTVGAGPQRLLALAMNHNGGWEATLDGVALAPVVVDGFRQAFVVPAGAAGALDVEFAPDSAYRWRLGRRAAARLLLLVGLLVPDRAPSATSRRPRAGTPALLVAAGTWSSPWRSPALGGARRGGCARGPAPAAHRRRSAGGAHRRGARRRRRCAGRRHDPPGRPSPGWRRRSPWRSSRQGCSPVRHPSCRPAHGGPLDEHVAQPRQEQADRQADGEQGHDATGEHPAPVKA